MRRGLLVLSLLLGGLPACGDDKGGERADAGFDCSRDDRGETYVAGMSHAGAAGYVFSIEDALPSPPSKNNNEWTVKVVPPDAGTLDGLELTVKLIMPDHNHGTSVIPVITPMDGGMFDIDPLNLWMPGVWKITLGMAGPDATIDFADFVFCIDG